MGMAFDCMDVKPIMFNATLLIYITLGQDIAYGTIEQYLHHQANIHYVHKNSVNLLAFHPAICV